jgi:nucleoside-diphosphate-sugar epimerase
VFNVCSGRAVSLREVIDTALRLTGQQMEVEVNADFVRANEVRVLKGSPEKLERAIGPLAHVPLEETLRWMLAEQ